MVMKSISTEQATQLLAITSKDQLETWLTALLGSEVFNTDDHWRLVGDQRSNAGAIEQSADEINPLVERIVNGMEAVIELRVANSEIRPSNLAEAIELLFGVPQGRARFLDEAQARKLAQHVRVTIRGQQQGSDPTIDVRDFGLGIHPKEFANTILALGQSDKGRKPYLIGMYGQGGSSTFDKCDYTVIVSRRHPDHLSDEEHDEIGWTVVRRSLRGRAPVYEYLVDPVTRSIPRVPGSYGNEIRLEHGTLISHVEYRDLGGFARQQMTNNAYYTLNYRLFDPLLPWTLVDTRNDRSHVRTMRGVPYRVGQLPKVLGIGSSEARERTEATAVRHHTEYHHEHTSGSSLRIEWWVLQDEQILNERRRQRHQERVRPYKDQSRRYGRRLVAITRGGQTHSGLTLRDTFIAKQLRQISRSIIVQVDTDGMTLEEGASFFASNRADPKSTSRDQVEEAINAAIDLHLDQLRAIERERQEEVIAGKEASDDSRIRQHLDPLIRMFHRTQSGRTGSGDMPQSRNNGFRGRQIPTIIEFAQKTILSVRPGIPTRVDLLTNASDTVVKHRRTQLTVESSNPDLRIGHVEGRNGRYRVDLYPAPELVVGTMVELTASIAQPDSWRLNAEQPRRIVIIDPPPPYEGKDPPTRFEFRARGSAVHVRQGGARISIESDATDTLLQNGAKLDVDSPDPAALPVRGRSGPNRGNFRVNLRVPDDAPLGDAGEIRATLRLSDGTKLEDSAQLVIDEKLKDSGSHDNQTRPNYEIRDVHEIPIEEEVNSWADMPRVLDGSEVWNGDDVGSYVRSGDQSQPKITFYLNADNRDLKRMEQQISKRNSVAAVDRFREMHRTLLCFHLYCLAAPNENMPETDYDYRDEMIRVGQTLLYTRNEFLNTILSENLV